MPDGSKIRLRFWLALLLPGAAASAALPELDRRLAMLAASGDFAGAVVIRRRDEVIYANGFGLADAEARRPFSPDTIVETGSVTKPVTAAALLWLADRGRIDLDSKVRRIVPEYPHEATTIRDLLTHSGGLPDYSAFEAQLNSGRVIRTSDLLGMMTTMRIAPAFTPGSHFSYCNICYDTLALVIERLTGENFGDFVRRRFLVPAGAGGVFLRPARLADWPGIRMKGYRRTPAGIEPNDVFDNEGFYGGGNLYFSAFDLAAWMSAWANGTGRVRRIRRTATALVLLQSGRSGLALGNFYCAPSRTRCYYPGHHQGFHAFGYWDSDARLAIAFVSNGTLSPRLQVEIPRLLIAAAERRPLPELHSEPDPEPPEEAQPPRLATYAVEGLGNVVLERRANKLFVILPGYTPYPLFPAGQSWLYAPGLDLYLREDGSDGLWVRSVFREGRGQATGDAPAIMSRTRD